MKKLLKLAAAMLFAVAVVCTTGCKKSSDNNDNNNSGGGGSGTTTEINKISEVYYGYTYLSEVSYDNGITWEQDYYNEEPSELNQEWYWDNDKITKINVLSSEKAYIGAYLFQYNNNGLVTSITNTDFNNAIQLSYNGNVISKVDSYYHGVLDETVELVYSNNHLIRMNYTYLNEDKQSDNNRYSLMNVLFSSNVANSYGCKDGLPYIELTWTGDNMTCAREVFPGEGEFVITFTYDSKNNPYYGNNSLTAWAFCSSDIMNLSKNNVLTENCADFTLTNSYHYSNYYPIQADETEIHHYTYDDHIEKDTFVANYIYNYLTK